MHGCKQYRVCRTEQTESSALDVVSVVRITPHRYSTRQAIRRYQYVQNDDGVQPSLAIIAILG